MKTKTIVFLGVSILFNIVFGTLLFSSFKSYRNVKDSYNDTKSKLEDITQKYEKQQEINDNLYTDYKTLKSDKEKLVKNNKFLSGSNKNLNRQVSVLANKYNKMHSRMLAGKKSSSGKKKYVKKSKYKKYKKTTGRYKRCR